MKSIQFTVIGTPVAKARPKVFFRGQKYPHAVTPKGTRQWEEMIRFQSIRHAPPSPLMGPLKMYIIFNMPRPKTLPKKVLLHTKKPDVDNLVKSVNDALQGLFYKSDSQICVLYATKRYTLMQPSVEITIEEI